MQANRLARRTVHLGLILLVGGLIAVSGCAAPKPPISVPGASATATPNRAIDSLTRVDEGKGNVTVEATWVTPAHVDEIAQASLKEYPLESYTLVHMKLDTHSVDLSKYDLTKLASLTWNNGTPIIPATWVAIQGSGGHHVDGVLVFPGQKQEQQLIQGGNSMQLAIKDLAGVPERDFRWDQW